MYGLLTYLGTYILLPTSYLLYLPSYLPTYLPSYCRYGMYFYARTAGFAYWS